MLIELSHLVLGVVDETMLLVVGYPDRCISCLLIIIMHIVLCLDIVCWYFGHVCVEYS
jgi:hypothetical protein